MIASFSSVCADCGNRIMEGTEIVHTEDGWSHAACTLEGKARDVCPDCWLEKPCACE